LTESLISIKITGYFLGGVPEWLKGADCKSAGYAFEGSNPSPSTTKIHKNAGSLVFCGCSSMVELQPSKLIAWVRFPSPAPWEIDTSPHSLVVEHFLGKEEVTGSIPVVGSRF
jgi:hypothetical protein